jgi:hypothetical protein
LATRAALADDDVTIDAVHRTYAKHDPDGVFHELAAVDVLA